MPSLVPAKASIASAWSRIRMDRKEGPCSDLAFRVSGLVVLSSRPEPLLFVGSGCKTHDTLCRESLRNLQKQ